LTQHPCCCYIGENVDEISKSGGENKVHIMHCLRQAGYVADVVEIIASDFGARTNRKRAWLVAFHLELSGFSAPEALERIRKIFALLEKLKLPPLPLEKFLLEDGHPWLDMELQRLLATRAAQVAKGPSETDTVWQKELVVLLEKQGLVWSQCQLPRDVAESPWCKCLCLRDQKCLAFNLATHPQASSIDVHPSIDRGVVGRDDMFPTFTGSSSTMILQGVKQMRLFSGYERLLVHGVPRSGLDVGRLAVSDVSPLANHCGIGIVAIVASAL
jgi:hypothetical protein